ncbi:MAG: DUF1554 domain-containing protein [Spirochaetales bacterium]|nr:DUF1554 domain-containing protein [Spirochaetales bacterium]
MQKNHLWLSIFILLGSCTVVEQFTGAEEKQNPATLLAVLLATQGSSSTSAFVGHVYVTNSAYNGNLGGVSGADAKCNSADANKPGSGTYKAMIVQGTTRRACSTANCTSSSENIDWVFKPGAQYYRSNRTTLIGTASSAGIFASAVWDTGETRFWTGLGSDWTNSANHCLSWTSGDNGQAGSYGLTDGTTSAMDCTGSGGWGNSYLLCVLQ